MHLLYCDANGIVSAIHSDEATAVPMAAYPAVVRIIPYNQPLSTLQRVGEPPPPPARGFPPTNDSRPYAAPEPMPDVLKLYAGQVRFNLTNTGFVFTAASGNIPVWTDRQSQMLINSLATWSANMPPDTAVHFTQGGVTYPLTAAECVTMFNQFIALTQQCRNTEAECLADLNSGSPTITTYEDVDARFAALTKQKKAVRPLPKMI